MITYKNKNKRMNREQEALFSQESFHIGVLFNYFRQKTKMVSIKIWRYHKFDKNMEYKKLLLL